jgi:CubicO group peptidase (beta-lactamase class C family)
MRVSLAIAVLFAVSAMTGCQPQTSALANNYQAESHTKSDDLSGERADATIAQVMSRMHVPGMALVVVRDGKVVKQSAYGVASLELGVPVTAATRFQIASATKVLTGTLVMQLVQDKTIALEAPPFLRPVAAQRGPFKTVEVGSDPAARERASGASALRGEPKASSLALSCRKP